jgi:hypothetical protein
MANDGALYRRRRKSTKWSGWSPSAVGSSISIFLTTSDIAGKENEEGLFEEEEEEKKSRHSLDIL